jgi:hypothetical protein
MAIKRKNYHIKETSPLRRRVQVRYAHVGGTGNLSKMILIKINSAPTRKKILGKILFPY